MAIIWRFKDGKPGHERQTAGLVEALGARVACDIYETTNGQGNPYWQWLNRSFPAIGPGPDFIIGAGSACQAWMLAARRSHGGKMVYLMRPKFPLHLFDLCVIPSHDSPPKQHNVIETEGVLNNLSATPTNGSGQDLILVGGPSKHHSWDIQQLLTQINELVEHHPDQRFLLSTSRRTPVDTVEALAHIPGLDFVKHDHVEPTWLAQSLAAANAVWVTADSISMMYEVLSVGANLGILEVPEARSDRITKVAPALISKSYGTSFLNWKETGVMHTSPNLNEAGRVAELIEQRFKETFK